MTDPIPYGLGRRKTAIAQVQLLNNEKTYHINGVDFSQYFPTSQLQAIAKSPLTITSQADTYGFRVKVQGGGKHAQADAVKLAIARALLEVDPLFRRQLKEAGMLRRDPRMKERKKYGLKRARRAPQFSKR